VWGGGGQWGRVSDIIFCQYFLVRLISRPIWMSFCPGISWLHISQKVERPWSRCTLPPRCWLHLLGRRTSSKTTSVESIRAWQIPVWYRRVSTAWGSVGSSGIGSNNSGGCEGFVGSGGQGKTCARVGGCWCWVGWVVSRWKVKQNRAGDRVAVRSELIAVNFLSTPEEKYF